MIGCLNRWCMEARKSIPKLFPEWTDENEHDPGITLLELMSWMTEMQQYYLNRVTERSERKFLKLLGIRPHEAVSAACEVAFAGLQQQLVLPKGTPLLAMDLRFETQSTVHLVPPAWRKCWSERKRRLAIIRPTIRRKLLIMLLELKRVRERICISVLIGRCLGHGNFDLFQVI